MTFRPHRSVRIAAVPLVFSPSVCSNLNCLEHEKMQHCHCCLCLTTETTLEKMLEHFKSNHVDPAIDFLGMKLLCCNLPCTVLTNGVFPLHMPIDIPHHHCFMCPRIFPTRYVSEDHLHMHVREEAGAEFVFEFSECGVIRPYNTRKRKLSPESMDISFKHAATSTSTAWPFKEANKGSWPVQQRSSSTLQSTAGSQSFANSQSSESLSIIEYPPLPEHHVAVGGRDVTMTGDDDALQFQLEYSALEKEFEEYRANFENTKEELESNIKALIELSPAAERLKFKSERQYLQRRSADNEAEFKLELAAYELKISQMTSELRAME